MATGVINNNKNFLKVTYRTFKLQEIYFGEKGSLPGVKRWLTFGVVRHTAAVPGHARAPALTPAVMEGVVWPGRRDCSTHTIKKKVHSPFGAHSKTCETLH